jgi:hypothetical protein
MSQRSRPVHTAWALCSAIVASLALGSAVAGACPKHLGLSSPAAPRAFAAQDAVGAVKPDWPGSWKSAASAPQPRFEEAAAVVAGKIYAFGGFSDPQFHVNRSYVSYDPAANKWTTLGTMPAGMAETHLGITADDRYIYFVGGFGGDLDTSKQPTQWISDSVWRYDTTNNTWQLIAKLPQARGAGGAKLVGRKLHYFGGNPTDRVTNVGEHYVYDLDSGAWSTAASMPDPKDHFSTVLLNDKIYAIGGEHGHDQLHLQMPDVHAYDTVTNTWTRLADLPTAKSHTEGATFATDGKIVMAGGQLDNYQPTSQVVAYDPAANAWATLPPLPAVRQGAIVQRIGYKVVVALGAVQTNQPQSGTWIGQLPLPPPPTNTKPPSAGATATRGVALESQAGTWNGAASLAERWQRCSDPAGAGSCSDIPGATSLAYTPAQADVGQYLRVVETAANDGGSATAASALTPQVGEPAPVAATAVPVAGRPGLVTGAPGRQSAATACRANRTVTLRWRAPRRRHLRTVVVSVNGVKYATLRGSRRRLTVRLKGLPQRTKITVRARDTAGRTLTASRTYRGCGAPTSRTLRLSAAA